jgi:hypothetical protein
MRLRNLFAGGAFALCSLGLFATPALADYTGTCADAPATITGNANIGDLSTNCSLGSVSATGYIFVQGSSVETGALTAGTFATVESGGSITTTGTIQTGPGYAIQISTGQSVTTASLSSGGGVSVGGTSITVNGNVLGSDGTVDLEVSQGDLKITGSVTSTLGPVILSATYDVTTGNVTADTQLTATAGSSGTLTMGTVTSELTADLVLSAGLDIVTGALNGGAGVGVTSTNGTITSGAINSNKAGGNGNVVLQAYGNVFAQSISTNGGATNGAIDIEANTGGGSTLFTIGASSTNGVATTLSTNNTSAGGGGVLINNGTANSTGGITVASGADINVSSSGQQAGGIFLNAQKGPFTLSAGTLSSDGNSSSNLQANIVIIQGQSVTAGSGTIISASQTAAATAVVHYVVIEAQTLTTNGLTVHADGDGLSANPAQADLLTPGTITVTSNSSLDFLQFTVNTNGNYFTNNVPLTVTGSGALTVTANGNNAAVYIGAQPITFSNAALTLQSKGTTAHSIEIAYFGTLTGTDGLVLNNTGTVTIDASGMTGNDPGGAVQIQLDKMSSTASLQIHADGLGTGAGGTVTFFPSTSTLGGTNVAMTANGAGTTGTTNVNFEPSGATAINSTTFSLTANGPASGNGNAGTVSFSAYPLTLGASTKGMLTANGPAAGTGNGGTVTLNPGFTGSASLGTNDGDFSLSATGGSSGGNGGTLTVNPGFGTIKLDTAQATALNVSVPTGKTGNGGTINLNALTLIFSGSGYAINANAGAQGVGGNINITGLGAVTIGTGAGAVELTADGAGTGAGGNISVTGQPVTVAGAYIAVNGGTSSNSDAGDITLLSNGAGSSGVLTVTGTLSANGIGSGTGGQVVLQGASVSINGAQIEANGGTSGSGNEVSVTSTGTAATSISGSTLLEALGGTSSGNGGNVILASGGALTLGTGVSLSSIAQSANGNGGPISVTSANGMTLNGIINSSAGTSSGSAGNVTLTDNTSGGSVFTVTSPTSLKAINADSPTTTTHGVKFIASTGNLTVTSTGLVSANNGTLTYTPGSGGNVTVTGNAGDETTSPLVGAVNSTGATIAFTVNSVSASNLTAGTITASSDLSFTLDGLEGLQTASGTITASTLEIATLGGSIGTSTTPLSTTSIGQIDVNAGGTGSAYIANTDSSDSGLKVVKIGTSATDTIGGAFQLTSSWDIMIQGNITAKNGAMTVKNTAAGRILSLATSRALSTTGGNMSLSVGGSARTTCPATTASCVPANVTFGGVSTLADIYFNTTGGIQAVSPLGDTIYQLNSRIISLDTNGSTGNLIQLGSGTSITAN